MTLLLAELELLICTELLLVCAANVATVTYSIFLLLMPTGLLLRCRRRDLLVVAKVHRGWLSDTLLATLKQLSWIEHCRTSFAAAVRSKLR